MNSQRTGIGALTVALFFIAAFTGLAQTDPINASNSSEIVELHGYAKKIALTEDQVQIVSAKSLRLLETSQFNSRSGNWPVSGVQKEYRETLSGKYLLISFKAPFKARTVGGKVTVQEIILGLDGSHFSSMFTIDDENRVVEQGKHRGDEWIELMKLVDKIADAD